MLCSSGNFTVAEGLEIPGRYADMRAAARISWVLFQLLPSKTLVSFVPLGFASVTATHRVLLQSSEALAGISDDSSAPRVEFKMPWQLLAALHLAARPVKASYWVLKGT
jgi:hypothetical protein